MTDLRTLVQSILHKSTTTRINEQACLLDHNAFKLMQKVLEQKITYLHEKQNTLEGEHEKTKSQLYQKYEEQLEDNVIFEGESNNTILMIKT